MLSEQRRAELKMVADCSDVVPSDCLTEALEEYDSCQRTWKQVEAEKLSLASRAAHYQGLLSRVVEQIYASPYHLELARSLWHLDRMVEVFYDEFGWDNENKTAKAAEDFIEMHPTWLCIGIELAENGNL